MIKIVAFIIVIATLTVASPILAQAPFTVYVPVATRNSLPTPIPEPTPTPSDDLVGVLRAAGSFDMLVIALEAANLTDALETGGPFTIFAPTDAAFAALPASAMEQLLKQPSGQLTQILLFHLLPGRVNTADISDGLQATTQQGRAVRFEVDGDNILVNGATIIVPDITASNGVIHAIDAVILPPID